MRSKFYNVNSMSMNSGEEDRLLVVLTEPIHLRTINEAYRQPARSKEVRRWHSPISAFITIITTIMYGCRKMNNMAHL